MKAKVTLGILYTIFAVAFTIIGIIKMSGGLLIVSLLCCIAAFIFLWTSEK